jgi:hypothetical protein
VAIAVVIAVCPDAAATAAAAAETATSWSTCWPISCWRERGAAVRRVARLALGGAGPGGAGHRIEFAQGLLTATRAADPIDALANTVGMILGWACAGRRGATCCCAGAPASGADGLTSRSRAGLQAAAAWHSSDSCACAQWAPPPRALLSLRCRWNACRMHGAVFPPQRSGGRPCANLDNARISIAEPPL